jgi:23S rRNA pseudouridine1911/1915/1917 synthase
MLQKEQFGYILTKDDEKRKLEEILRCHFHFSRKVIQKLKIGEHVWLDGKFLFKYKRKSWSALDC